MELSYPAAVRVLTDAFAVDEDRATMFDAKLKAFRKYGTLKETKEGRGHHVRFREMEIFRLMMMVVLSNQVGIKPTRAAEFVVSVWPQLARSIEMAWRESKSGATGARYLAFQPDFWERIPGKRPLWEAVDFCDDRQLARKLQKSGGLYNATIVINLTGMIERLEQALQFTGQTIDW